MEGLKIINKEEFFKKFTNHCEKDLENIGMNWEDLKKIERDYINTVYNGNIKANVEPHIFKLSKIENVHSVNYRVKDPEHLIEKIIRKNKEKIKIGKELITIENYKDEITDIYGFRVFHLYKEDGIDIFNNICEYFEVVDNDKVCFCSTEDEKKSFEEKFKNNENNIKIETHNKKYSSIHVGIIHTDSTNSSIKTKSEIQIRTLAEEIWAEIDHSIRYPYLENDKDMSAFSENLFYTTKLVDDMIANSRKLLNSFKEKNEEIDKLKKEIQNIESITNNNSRDPFEDFDTDESRDPFEDFDTDESRDPFEDEDLDELLGNKND